MKKIFLFLTALVAAFTLSAAPVELSRRAARSGGDVPALGARVGERPVAPRGISRASSAPSMLYAPMRTVHYSAAPAFAQALTGELYGVICFDSSGACDPGLYRIPMNANTGLENVFSCGMVDIGTFVAGGKLYAPIRDMITGFTSGISVYSLPGGAFDHNISVTCSYVWATSVWVPSMDAAVVFGLGAEGTNNALLKATLDGNVSVLATYSSSFNLMGGLAVSADGKLYGLSTDGKLYAINTQTFNTSLIGSTDVKGDYASAMTYDDENNLIHAVNSPKGNSTLYSIDPATGATEVRYNFSSSLQVNYMYIGEDLAPKGAPAAVSDLAAIFEKGSLSGKVTFTAPPTTYDGKPASGSLSYVVMSDGRKLASGQSSFGAAIEAPVTLAAAGPYKIEVYCSNGEGDGPKTEISGYAGPDTPASPANVVARYDNGRIHLTWSAPTGVNGGYVDPSQVSYVITRYVNGTATELPAVTGVTEYSEPWTEPADSFQTIFYSVKSMWNGTATLATPTNTLRLGCVLPPYEVPLANSSDARALTVIDNNHDSATWTFDESKGKPAMRYNWSNVNKGDDYLVLPAARLEKGKAYFFSFVAGVEGSNYPERYEIVVGTAPTAEGLSTVLKPETEINIVYGLNSEGKLVGQRENVLFVPEADGNYYFAVRATSPVDSYRLYVSDMAISAGVLTTAPAAVGNLKLTPDPQGAESVTIEFTAPALDINNAVLSSLDKVLIYRGEEEIASLTPAPGAKASYKDENAGSGNVAYTVVPVNASGRGIPVRATVFVGVNAPAAPAEVLVTKGADYGEVLVSWTPVTQDINGVPLADVLYTVLRYNGSQWEVVSPDITETSYAVRACQASDPQSFAQFAVIATNKAGSGPGKAADPTPVGAPYTMPYAESFLMKQILGIMSSSDDLEWMILKDSDIEGLTSQDGDNAYAGCGTQTPGVTSRVFTGRISIPAAVANPVFSFHYFCQAADDANYFQLYVNDGSGKFEPVGDRKVLGEGTPGSWNRVTLPLDAYKGKDVQIAIDLNIIAGGYGSEFIDNLSLRSMVDNDLSISLSLPPVAQAGEKVTLSATVLNGGMNAEPAYGVDFVVDDRVVASLNGTPLASGESKTYTYDYAVSELSASELKVMARVNCGKDSEWANNAETAMLPVELPLTPWVTDLSAAVNDNGGVELSWNEPDTAGSGEAITDDFEAMDAFATMDQGDLAGWTFLDRDNELVGSFEGLDIPNITPPCTASFFVSEDTYAGYQNATSFGARSGHKYLAALFNNSLAANDDWAISPELAGCAQTISFYARAYHPQYPETLEVLYSTTDRNPQSFKAVTRFEDLSTDVDAMGRFFWTECTFQVPEGAKYFAIRYVSKGAFMVMVDDATYVPAGADPLLVEGYNVYRNGVKLNDTPVTGTTFTDPEHVENAAYVVTAVYAQGESRASNVVYPHGNAVGSISGETLVKGLRGEIEVSGAASQVSVADMQGRVIYAGTPGRIPAAPGAYLVRVDRRRAVKVLVK